MSNHFTGLSLGPPLGDPRLDLCDLYAFQSPADPTRTAIILNANVNVDALHPDAIYRVNIDNDGDCLTDIAFSYVFAPPKNGQQTVSVFVAKGADSRSVEAVGTKIIADAAVSFGPKPDIHKSGSLHVLRRRSQRRFLFRLRRNQESVRHQWQAELHRAAPGQQVAVDRSRFEHGSQYYLDGDRTADQRARRQVSHPHLGTMQRAQGRPADSCRSRRPSERQQLLQHQRYQAGIQRERAELTTRSDGPTSSSICSVIRAATRAKKQSPRSTPRAFCPTC